MERVKQLKSVAINRGLFLVRYAAAGDPTRPPVVKLAPNPASNKTIDFLLHPDQSEPVLWQPDSCLVVRASTPGELTVEVVPADGSGSAAATVRIEPLTQGLATTPSKQAKRRSGAPYDLGNLRILSHVTGIGDRRVKVNEWIAGPSAPARIEGIAIEWPDKPHDLEIHYAVKTAKPQTVSGRAMGLGAFAGTRGKAMPVVSLMLELSGPAAAALQFVIDAIFLGSPTMRMIGRRIILSGQTGREPLVGLRLALESVPKSERMQVTAAPISVDKGAANVSKRHAIRPKSKVVLRESESLPPRPRVLRNRAKSTQPVVA